MFNNLKFKIHMKWWKLERFLKRRIRLVFVLKYTVKRVDGVGVDNIRQHNRIYDAVHNPLSKLKLIDWTVDTIILGGVMDNLQDLLWNHYYIKYLYSLYSGEIIIKPRITIE